MKKFKEENFIHLIDYQMELNWYEERFNDLKLIPSWYDKFTTTEEVENKFKEYAIKYLSKFYPKSKLERKVWMFILWYWLRTIR